MTPASGSSPATRSTSPRGSSRRRRPIEVLHRRPDLPARPRARRGRARRAARAEGQVGARARVPAARRPRRAAAPRRRDAPLVGREREPAALDDALDARSSAPLRLATRHGRRRARQVALIEEFARRCGGEALVLRGRCLSYGDGITFWPLRRGGARGRRHRGRRRRSPRRGEARRRSSATSRDVAERSRAAVGLVRRQFPLHESSGRRASSSRSCAAAAARARRSRTSTGPSRRCSTCRRTCSRASRTRRADRLRRRGPSCSSARPAGASADAARSRSARSARPDAERDRRPPARRRVDRADVAARIVEAAEGNPLFVEQLVSMMRRRAAAAPRGRRAGCAPDDSAGWVPPTIHALLGARLDRLAREERAVIDPASVIGLQFAAGAARGARRATSSAAGRRPPRRR